jgi:hypothetical protein
VPGAGYSVQIPLGPRPCPLLRTVGRGPQVDGRKRQRLLESARVGHPHGATVKRSHEPFLWSRVEDEPRSARCPKLRCVDCM